MLETDIEVNGDKVGKIEVSYLEKRPEEDEGPFLKEERNLIDSMANHIGSFIERRIAEKKMIESENKYRAITEKSHDAIFIIGQEDLLFVNERTAELTGYSKEELYEMDFWDLIHPEDRTRLIEIDLNVSQGSRGILELLNFLLLFREFRLEFIDLVF